MKLLSSLLLALGLVVTMADDSANLRVGAESRQLGYSSSGNYGGNSGNSGTSVSSGTWLWYLALNALCAPKDHFEQCTLVQCGHADKADVPKPCKERLNCAPSAHPHPKPKKKSGGGGGGGGGGNNDDNKVIHWGNDGYWANDGHSQWSDDGNYWYDDGGWDDDAWANDGYWYWDDDGHNGQAKWLANNGTTQSNKNKILYPLMFVGLVVGALAVALVARRNKRRREEEEYYASQQPGYVAPAPKEKKKWYQKFRRNKKEGRDSPAIQLAAQDESVGGDFTQMQDDDDRSMGNGSLGGWSARSWNNRTYA
jgi:hypothetical protein